MRSRQQVKDSPRAKRQLPKELVSASKSFRHQNRGIQAGRLNPK